MNKTRFLASTLLGLGLLGSVGLVIGDDDFRRSLGGDDVAPVDFAPYQEECGGCHMAYPPGLLPAEAWQQVFDNLGDQAQASRTAGTRGHRQSGGGQLQQLSGLPYAGRAGILQRTSGSHTRLWSMG